VLEDMMFLLSFWTQDYLVLNRTFTLNNYIEAFTQPVYQLLFSRSLTISLTVTFFTVLLAYPMAYFISFHGGNRKALWLFLITIPFWTSYLLRMFLWKVILWPTWRANFLFYVW
jgi:ABC-type spermidine/putrescine transport system, permease component I